MLRRMDAPRIVVLADTDDPLAARIADRLGASRAVSAREPPGADVAFVVAPREGLVGLRRHALDCTLAGVKAVVLVSAGGAAPLPWWGRRFHRILCASQNEARAWRAAGVALGRLVVVEEGPDDAVSAALRALVAETWAMATRRPFGPVIPARR
jgi:hypothetical protein